VFTGALSAAARHEFRLVIVDLQHVAMHKRDEQLAGLLCPQLDDVIAQSARDPEAPPGISPRISCLEQAHRFPEMRESRHLAIRIRQGLGSIEARIGLHVTQADAEIPWTDSCLAAAGEFIPSPCTVLGELAVGEHSPRSHRLRRRPPRLLVMRNAVIDGNPVLKQTGCL
jgi:hypothetical protein